MCIRDRDRTDYGSKRGRNSFLNTALAPIAQKSIVVDSYGSNGINVITQENYEFLRDSFFNYALLLKQEAVHTPGKSIGASIANLYDEMDKLVGEGMNVNIEQDNGRLYFNLWKCHKWGELTLYYFPIDVYKRQGYDGKTISQYVKANFNQGRLDFYNENPDRRRDASQRNVVSATQRQGEENRQARGASIA